MIWLYRILFLPFLIITLPYYLKRMFKRGGYVRDFHHRFGFIASPEPKKPSKKRIWLQAVSVGEIQAISALLEKLAARGDVEVILTTTTSTAYQIARERYGNLTLRTGTFPLDFWPFSALAWHNLQPDLCLLMEGELWPEHIHQAKKRGVPIMLMNARLSNRSFSRYQKARWFAKPLLRKLDRLLASSQYDLDRYLAVGANPTTSTVTGNMKFDVAHEPALSEKERIALKAELGFEKDDVVLLGSSTWDSEEEPLITVLQQALTQNLPCRLLLCPRHFERGKSIAALSSAANLSWHLRTEGNQAPKNTCIYIADTTGELKRLTQICDVAFVGKSLPPNKGGQTPIEAAAAGKAVVYGPDMSNFNPICKSLEDAQAAIRVADKEEAIATLLDLLTHTNKREVLAKRAASWYHQNQGATQRTLEGIGLE